MILRWAPVLLVGACQPATLPAPRLDRVEPAFAYNGEEHTVTIEGGNFFPQVEVSAANGAIDVDRSFSAWLVGPGVQLQRTPFAGVSILDDTALRATVEAGLEPGLYDLEVEGPTGKAARLPQAFTITDTQAVQLLVSSPRVVYSISEAAQIDIRLVDLGGDVVEIPLEIAVVASAPALFDPGTLANTVPTPDDDGIRGLLQAGVATVTVQPGLPGQVRIAAAPWDPAVTILDDFVDLTFEPGEDWTVELTLPPGPTQYTAGEIFTIQAQLVDQYDNPVQTPASVTLRTGCSGWVGDVELSGPTPVEVVPEFTCKEDRISVVRGPTGESEPFDVIAGPADHFELLLAQSVRTAGETLNVLVDPVDAYGNRTSWSGTLALQTSREVLDGQCVPQFGSFYCTPIVTLAGDNLTVQALGDDGLVGQIGGLVVLPDDVPASVEVTVAGPAAAGVPHPVEVVPRDTWDNDMDAAVLGAPAFALVDDLGEATCVSTGFGVDGEALFDCTMFTARADATLTCDLASFAVQGTSAAFQVDNGALATVDFTGEADVVAGDSLTLTLSASDAWGNPYVVQDDPDVDLVDDGGSWTTPATTLLPTGTGTTTGTLTRAGTTRVRAFQGGVELGASDPIAVDPGPTTALQVTPLAPWAWVGDPLDIRVESIDVYGNRTDLGGTATLTSTLTASPGVAVTLVNGVGVNAFTWTSPALLEVLDASAAGFVGSSVELVVGSDCGATGPTPVVTFGGSTDAVACVDPLTDLATISADFSTSVAGSSALSGYAIAPLGGSALVDTVPVLDLSLPGSGVHPLLALAVDVAGCAAETTATAWTGPDDGSVVGPVPLSTTATDVAVFDLVTFDVVGATDCSGDPASGQDLLVRSTVGDLSGVTATGAGLALALDANGDGGFSLLTTGHLQAGTAAIHAWVPSGGGGALLELPLTGDNVLPTVLGQDPAGLWAGPVPSVWLEFSEPMLASTLIPSNFTVTGPSPVSVVAVTPGSVDDVTLTLDVPADASSGVWTVTAAGIGIRDAAGNRLAGDWGATFANYLGAFGDITVAVDDVTCEASGTVLAPDGDDGESEQADLVSVDLTSAQAPAWWVVDVLDDASNRVDQQWLVPTGPMDTVSWDGRALSGIVVDNGTYTLQVRPDDGLGNRGAGCDLVIRVENAIGPQP